MEKCLTKTDEFVYDHSKLPLSVHNRRVATQNGWTYDKDFNAYRDTQGFVMLQDSPPQTNNIDCWK